MVRIIVGKLILIGKGLMSVEEFEHYLLSKESPVTLEPAFPQGLYLSKVNYPFLDIPPRTDFLSMLHSEVSHWEKV
jgi:tRNA pseudouridine38-40 synthase